MHPEFQVHRLTEAGLDKAQEIAEAFDRLLTEITPHIGVGREAALVRTKLEEASFYAKKAMAQENRA